jgi:hypothetical protein
MFLSKTCFGMEFRTFFSSTEQFGTEFREFPVSRNISEQNSENLLLFLFHGKEFPAFSSSRNSSERNSESFLFRGTAGIQLEQTNCSVYSVFRGIIFLSEIANPTLYPWTFWNSTSVLPTPLPSLVPAVLPPPLPPLFHPSSLLYSLPLFHPSALLNFLPLFYPFFYCSTPPSSPSLPFFTWTN